MFYMMRRKSNLSNMSYPVSYYIIFARPGEKNEIIWLFRLLSINHYLYLMRHGGWAGVGA